MKTYEQVKKLYAKFLAKHEVLTFLYNKDFSEVTQKMGLFTKLKLKWNLKILSKYYPRYFEDCIEEIKFSSNKEEIVFDFLVHLIRLCRWDFYFNYKGLDLKMKNAFHFILQKVQDEDFDIKKELSLSKTLGTSFIATFARCVAVMNAYKFFNDEDKVVIRDYLKVLLGKGDINQDQFNNITVDVLKLSGEKTEV